MPTVNKFPHTRKQALSSIAVIIMAMLTDTPQPPFAFEPTVDDFFNLDILNSAFTASSSQSSSSPRSPFSFTTPLTPPSTRADDDFFAQFLDSDEFTKGPSLSSLSVPPYDIFGPGVSATGSSPESIDPSTPI